MKRLSSQQMKQINKKINMRSSGAASAYKSELTAFFSFFQIDREDAYSMVGLLENIDEHYTGRVTMDKFADRYCASCRTSFLALHHYFYLISKGNEDKRHNVMSAEQFGSDAKQAAQDSHGDSGRVPVTYLHVLSFLFLLLSVPDTRIMELLYWMVFAGPQRQVTEEELLGLFDRLHRDPRDSASPPEENNDALSLRREKLANLCKQVDLDSVTAYRLQLFDIRGGGMYSRTLHLTRRTLQNNLGGKKTWLPLSSQFHRILLSLEEHYNEFERIPFHQHKYEKATGEFVVVGMRRQGRKELRKYIRLLLDFLKVETSEQDESKSSRKKGGFFSKVLRSLPSSSAPSPVSSSSTPSLWGRLFSSTREAERAMALAAGPEEEEEDLEEKYGDALDQPLEEITRGLRVLLKESAKALKKSRAVLEAAKLESSKKSKGVMEEEKGTKRREREEEEDEENEDEEEIEEEESRKYGIEEEEEREEEKGREKAALEEEEEEEGEEEREERN